MKTEKKLPPVFGRFARPGRFLDKQPSSVKAPPQKKPEALKQNPTPAPAPAALLILLLLSLVFGSMAEAATFGQFETSTPSGVYTNRLLWNLAASTTTNRIYFTNSSSAFGNTNTSSFNIKSNSAAGRWEWRSGTTVLATNAVNRPYATWLTNGVGAGTYGYTRYEPSTIVTIQLDQLGVLVSPTNFFDQNSDSIPGISHNLGSSTNLPLSGVNGLASEIARLDLPSPVQIPSSLFSSWNSGSLLLTNGNSIQDSNSLAEATIGNIGSTMALYYTSYDGGYTGRIWAAYGSLLNGFTKHGIVLAPTASSWDASSIGGATHYREGITNYLYYFGGNNAAGFEVDPLSIGVAYSTDGTNYTKYSGNPIMRSNNVAASCVTCYTWFTKKTATGYLGFFNAKHNTGAQERIHMASASNPLGPWTYVGEIFHHTNATITSDFTVADLPSGGYIAAYWMVTNGSFAAGAAYSSDLTNWLPAGPLNGVSLVGTRLFYDDGIALSYCVGQSAVYYARPKKSTLGNVIGSSFVATAAGFVGDGSGLTNVAADNAKILNDPITGQPAFGAGWDNGSIYWWTPAGASTSPTHTYDMGYNADVDRWFTKGGMKFGLEVAATNGFASFASVASVSIASTGWTNIWTTNNAVVVFGGTTVSSFKKRAGALTSTNITYPVFTGNSTVILQPGQALVTSGTSVTGTADPF